MGLFCLYPKFPSLQFSSSPDEFAGKSDGGFASGEAMAPARSWEKEGYSESEKKLETRVIGPGLKYGIFSPPKNGSRGGIVSVESEDVETETDDDLTFSPIFDWEITRGSDRKKILLRISEVKVVKRRESREHFMVSCSVSTSSP